MRAYRILFVCLGNICRSPTAEGVCRQLVAQRGWAHCVTVDSAGTSTWHAGEPPDRRSQEEALRRGVDLSAQRARGVVPADFDQFDVLLAMDSDNLAALRKMCPPAQAHKLGRLLDHAPHQPVRDVPDPYYGGEDGFRRVFDLVEAGCAGFLQSIESQIAVLK